MFSKPSMIIRMKQTCSLSGWILRKDHPWVHRQIQQIESIPGLLIAAVLRGGEAVMPKGDTRVNEGDALILVAKEYIGREGVTLSERTWIAGAVR